MPKTVDHDQYRAELAAGCVALFAERGYGAVTMREAAAHLGVSTGTLYHYFDAKEALFEATVEAAIEDELADAAATILELQGRASDPAELLVALVQRRWPILIRRLGVLLEYTRGGARSLGAAGERAHDRYVLGIQGILGLADRGAADMVLAVLDGLVLRELLGGPRFDPEGALRMIRALVAAAVAPPP
ncbi:MAG: helix-turn-helix domain-containing protein [Nannocystaceae bacterium]